MLQSYLQKKLDLRWIIYVPFGENLKKMVKFPFFLFYKWENQGKLKVGNSREDKTNDWQIFD